MEEVFRVQKEESTPLTYLLTCLDTVQILCLPATTASQEPFQIRKGVDFGILETLEVWPTNQLMKSFDSQDKQHCKKINVKPELHFCMQTDDDIRPGIISKNPRLQFEGSPKEWTHCLEPFPSWDSRLLLISDFSVMFKPKYRQPKFHKVCAVTLFYCFF